MGTKLVKHQKSKRSDVNIEFEIWSKTQFEVKFKKFMILRFHIRYLKLAGQAKFLETKISIQLREN